jgi:hypothetical protein
MMVSVIMLVVIISLMSYAGETLYANEMLSFAARQSAQYVANQIAKQTSETLPDYLTYVMPREVQMVTTNVLKSNNIVSSTTATAQVDNNTDPQHVTVTTKIGTLPVFFFGGVLGAILPSTISVSQVETVPVRPGNLFPFSAQMFFPGNDPGWVNFGHNGGAVLVPCYGYSMTTPYAPASGSIPSPPGQRVVTVDQTQWMWQPDSGAWEHATLTYPPQ